MKHKHQKLVYHDYFIGKDGFSYHFSLDGSEESEYVFRPEWRCVGMELTTDDPILRQLVFNLGMAELVSYWKCACPPIVEIHCGGLDDWQIAWWKKLYRHGLGEFFYVNGIVPADDFMTIVPTKANTAVYTDNAVQKRLSGCFIPVGGGKDSIVTMELLKQRENSDDDLCYIVGDIKRAYDSAITAGYTDSRIIRVSRTIAPSLLELNKKGYLNGHTPFSAIVAFSALVFAYQCGNEYIVLSNESSANEGNCNADFGDVNHQYSKSTEFERDFREYTDRLYTGLPNYFSLLRPWNEMQITRKFVNYPQYFSVFQSCNAGTKTNTWCCKCAKCLYVYIMLAAFLDDDVLCGIFGGILLDNHDLSPLLNALVNPDYDKPFECVGTREEVNYALFMAAKRRGNGLPLLLRKYMAEFAESFPSDFAPDLTDYYDDVNYVPADFLRLFYEF